MFDLCPLSPVPLFALGFQWVDWGGSDEAYDYLTVSGLQNTLMLGPLISRCQSHLSFCCASADD
jgi:hypothetical protein